MATELEDKQGSKTSIASPNPAQAHYDREFAGITSPSNYNKDAEDPNGSLQSQEKSGDSGFDSASKSSSKDELRDAEGLKNNRDEQGVFSNDGGDSDSSYAKLKSLVRRNKKKAVGGSIAGLLLGGGIYGSIVLTGPLQFIHFAQNLQKFHFFSKEDFDNDRSSKVLLYALAGNTAGGRLGATSNVAANKWEKRLVERTGMRPVYSNPTGRFVGFELVDENKAFNALGSANERDTARLESIAGKNADFTTAGEASRNRQPLQGIDGKKLPDDVKILDLRDVSLKDRRLMTKVIGRQTGTNNIVTSVGSRLMIKRGGIDFHPLKNIVRNKGDSLADYRERVRDQRDQQVQTGSTTRLAAIGAGSETNADGNETISPEDQRAAQEANDAIEEARNADSDGLKGLKTGLNAAKGPAAVIGILCAVKSVGDGAEQFKYDNTMKLMRYGASYLTIASQAMSGQGLNLDELGAFSETLYDEKTGLGWDSARSIQAENGENLTGPEIAPESVPSQGDDQRDIFKAVNAIRPLDPVCSTINAVAGLPIIKQVGSVISAGSEFAINQLLEPFGYTLDSLGAAAIAAVAGKSIDLDAAGPDAGNLANYGARLMANDQFVSTGGRALTSTEELALKENRHDDPVESIAQRYFDPYLATSLTGNMINKLPANASQAGYMMRSSVQNLFTSITSVFGIFTTPKTSAATDYNYGFPKFGYSEQEMNDERFEDPYKNEASLVATLAATKSAEQSCAAAKRSIGANPYPSCELGYSSLNELNTGDSDFGGGDGDTDDSNGSDKNLAPYGAECFSSAVDELGTISTGKSVNMGKLPASCATDKEIFLRYRFYIADTITAKSLACYEAGDEAACTEMGFGSAIEDGQSSPTTSLPGDIFGASADLPCQIGTDGGIQDGYNNGTLVKIRVCIVNGTDTNVKMEKNLDALYKKAAADGIRLTAGGFRTMAEQQDLYNQNCRNGKCSPATAKPGFSNHQMGLAYDFRYNGATICFKRSSANCNGNAGFDWLKANAADFGLKNFPKEAWHWSVDGT